MARKKTSLGRKQFRHDSPEYADLARTLRRKYEDGATVRELAAEFGRSYGWVHRALEAAGTQLRPRGGGPRRKKD